MDVDTIELGEDFVEAIESAVSKCDVLIALIGSQWLDIRNQSGQRRLDDPNDFIRLEIATALRRNIRVIPILLGDATMPRSEDLPDDLAMLARRQALVIRASSPNDIKRLMDLLEKKVFQAGRQHSETSTRQPSGPTGACATPAVESQQPQRTQMEQFVASPLEQSRPRESAESRPRRDKIKATSQREVSQKVIGIDLGTTNSVVAVVEGGEVELIANTEGNRTTPSVVAITEGGETLVGEPARRQSVLHPLRTLFSIKRFMGRRNNEIENEERSVPYKLSGGPTDFVKVQVDDREYMPAVISSFTLRKLKEAAEAHVGATIKRAIITVPAYFNDSQRQATRDASRIAGLEAARIINEPTAAALAFGHGKLTDDKKIVVFDLGGGTFDVSVLETGCEMLEVLSTCGDTHLGGDDFDQVLLNYVADEFESREKIDLRNDALALQRLLEACERAKRELSDRSETDINLPFIAAGSSGPLHLQMPVSREQYEKLTDHLVERCRKPLNQALADAKLPVAEIDVVLLVGGSTRMPRIQRFVADYFGKEPAHGVNPDEVVAIGAAIQGGIISGDVRSTVLMDVTPLTLGIETKGGICTPLIERNSTIPITKSQTFSTARDNQKNVKIHVLQGEREMAADNRSLGRFRLKNIPPAPRGAPQIKVSFDVDVNGILHVSAKDEATGKERSILVETTCGLSADEIERLRAEIENRTTTASSDTPSVDELANLRERAEQTCLHAEALVKNNVNRSQDADANAVHQAIYDTRSAAAGENEQAIRSAISKLEKASSALVRSIFGIR